MKIHNQTQPLSHMDQQLGRFTNMSIVAEAKRANCWIYNKLYNTWYTPEEFHAKYANREDTNVNIRTLLENISIRDPKQAIAAYHKLLAAKLEKLEQETNELRNKGEAFTQKVLSYYQDKSKDKFK